MFKYKFTSDTGRTIVITTDKKLTAKQRRDYMACLPGVVSYTREPMDNPPAKPVRLVSVMEGLADQVDALQVENDQLKARVQELEQLAKDAIILADRTGYQNVKLLFEAQLRKEAGE